jgi:Protein of unknown function (DUF3311)
VLANGPVPTGQFVNRGGPRRAPVYSTAYVVSATLLASSFVALLWVPSYARLTPALAGIPFFYWYSILWLVVNAGCQAVAYQLLVAGPRRRARSRPDRAASAVVSAGRGTLGEGARS